MDASRIPNKLAKKISRTRSSRSIPRCSACEASRVYPLTRVSSSGGGADATRSMVDRWSMKVVGIDHVQVAAPAGCEAEARAFYGAVLGLVEVPKPAALRAAG